MNVWIYYSFGPYGIKKYKIGPYNISTSPNIYYTGSKNPQSPNELHQPTIFFKH